MPRILIVSAFDPLPGEGLELIRYPWLARALQQKGAEVTMLSAGFSHFHKQTRETPANWNGITFRLIPVPPYRQNISLARFWSHTVFAYRAWLWLRQNADQFDLIVSALPPVELNVLLSRFAKRKHIPFILDIQDLWPEAWLSALPGWLSALLLPFVIGRRNRCLQRVTALCSVSADYLARLPAAAPATAVWPLGMGGDITGGSPCELLPPRRPGELRLVFLGASSRVPPLEALLRHADKLPADISLICIGRSPLFQNAPPPGGQVFFFHDLPEAQKYSLLQDCDVGLVFADPDLQSRFPNKCFSYWQMGLPLISTIEGGELQHLLEHYPQLGHSLCGSEAAGAEALLKTATAMAQRTKREEIQALGAALFGKTRLYERYADWVLSRGHDSGRIEGRDLGENLHSPVG